MEFGPHKNDPRNLVTSYSVDRRFLPSLRGERFTRDSL